MEVGTLINSFVKFFYYSHHISASNLSLESAAMAEKEMIMKLKVDVDCEKCMKKVKKVLCKFPEIRDKSIDEKQNLITIIVVCFDPEKLRDKICCKSEGSIKIIEMLEIPKKKPDGNPTPSSSPKAPQSPPKAPPSSSKAPQPPPVIGYPPQLMLVPIRMDCAPWHKGRPGGPCYCGCYYGRPSTCDYCYYYGRPVYDGCGGECRRM